MNIALIFRDFVAIVLIVCLSFLISCNEIQPLGPNRVDKDHVYKSRQNFAVRVYLYETQDDLQEAYAGIKSIPAGLKMEGFTVKYYRTMQPTQIERCDIHVVDSPNDPDPRIWLWGHELKHCIKGSYHTE